MDCLFRQNNTSKSPHKSNSVPKNQWEEGDKAPSKGSYIPSTPHRCWWGMAVGSSVRQPLLGVPWEQVASALHTSSSPNSLCQLSSPGPGQCPNVHPFTLPLGYCSDKNWKFMRAYGNKKRAGFSNSPVGVPVVVVFYLVTSHTNIVPSEGTNPEGTNPPNPQGTIFIEGAVESLK